VFAQAIADSNSVAIGIHNSFSPSKAVGAALSSNVKINGIEREAPSYSSADLDLGGQAGTAIIERDREGRERRAPRCRPR
ncbi:hypothetical protein PPH41_22675, partial [Burkholderia gladioli]|nr:hypothetical protein [Burkholderia gladioli]